MHQPEVSLQKPNSVLFSCLGQWSHQVNIEEDSKQCKYVLISLHMAGIPFHVQHSFSTKAYFVSTQIDLIKGMPAHSSKDVPREIACE